MTKAGERLIAAAKEVAAMAKNPKSRAKTEPERRKRWKVSVNAHFDMPRSRYEVRKLMQERLNNVVGLVLKSARVTDADAP